MSPLYFRRSSVIFIVGLATMNLIFSRRLAIAIGVALLLGETMRLWGGGPIAWGMDHYVMGVFLFFGAWRSRRYDSLGSRYLIAAWAFTCGVGYMNFVRHLERLHNSDPARVPNAWIAIGGVGVLLCIVGLAASLRAQDGPANGRQPFNSETNRTSSAAGSRR